MNDSIALDSSLTEPTKGLEKTGTACMACGGMPAFSYRVLEVQTLHVRSLYQDSRIQALGRFQNMDICRECAEKKLQELLHFSRRKTRALLLFAGLALAGLWILLQDGKGELLGFAGLFLLLGGAMGGVGIVQSWYGGRQELLAIKEEDRLERAAWLCLLEKAPGKSLDSDLSYIPADRKTLALKKGDFMVLYDLLPEVADSAMLALRQELQPFSR